MKNKSSFALIGAIIAIAALLVATLYFVPVVSSDSDEGDLTENGNTDIEVETTLKFKDGDDYIYEAPFSFTYNNEEITTAEIVVSWNTFGSDIDWSTLSLTFDLRIWWDYQTDITLKTDSFTSTEQSGSKIWSYDLASLLNPSDNPDNTWNVNFDVSISGFVEDTWGSSHTSDLDLSTGAYIVYDGTDFEVVGTIAGGVSEFNALGGGPNPIVNPFMALFGIGIIFVVLDLYGQRR